MTQQPKSKLMKKLRDARRAAGLERLDLWIRPKDRERFKRYEKRILKDADKPDEKRDTTE